MRRFIGLTFLLLGAMPMGTAEALPSSIRVGLKHSTGTIVIEGTGSWAYVPLHGGKQTRPQKGGVLRVAPGKDHDRLRIGDQEVYGALLVAPTRPEDGVKADGRRYRGFLMIQPGERELVVINQVSLEEYLYGVLPREISPHWPEESLKAQAVVSRTFVVSHLGKYERFGYDVKADAFSQMYGGVESEQARSNQAVDLTAGEILTDPAGLPIRSFFHSSCGGRTETPQAVWTLGQERWPYLISRRDSACRSEDPYYRWRVEWPEEVLRVRLQKEGFQIGKVRRLKVRGRSPSGRAREIRVVHAEGQCDIPSNRFRLAVGSDAMRSTLLTRVYRKGNRFCLEGHGWGHGVGFCQWGAMARAKSGDDYRDILRFYYPHAQLLRAPTSERSQPTALRADERSDF